MSRRSLLLVGLLGLVRGTAQATPAASLSSTGSSSTAPTRSRPLSTDIIPLSEVRPGMKGYGLTVFQGTKPERFDVQVIGVLKNFRPKQDLILVKTKHPRLEITKVVAGMSGSPIY